MADLLLAKPTPGVSIDSKAEWILFSERNPYPSIEELAMPEYKIAGMRINPNNYSPSRQTFVNSFSLKISKREKPALLLVFLLPYMQVILVGTQAKPKLPLPKPLQIELIYM